MSTRAVLVTGASTGIGRATALLLAQTGWTVFAGVRKEADAESVRTEARGELEPILMDVTDEAQIAAAAEHIHEVTRGSGLTALVNNAGTAHAGPLEFLDLDDFRAQLEVNLIGQVAVTRAMLPMLRANRGRVVNITSVGGLTATPFMGPYCASKFALEAISDCLRTELRPWKVDVIAVEPGSIATEIWNRGTKNIEEARTRMPDEAERLYGKATDQMIKVSAEADARGIPPEEAARVIEKALTAKRPKTRYLVGRDAIFIKWVPRLLPDRAWDAMSRRALKLPG